MKLGANWFAMQAWGYMFLLVAPIHGQAIHPSNLTPASNLTITPSGPVIVESGSHRQFIANVIGSNGVDVIWVVEGDDCGKRECGSVSNDGFYSAPNRIEEALHLRIVASETFAPFFRASAQITVTPLKTHQRREPCKSSEPGYCSLGWQIHQAFSPFAW